MGKSDAANEVITSLKRAKLEQEFSSNIIDSSGTISYANFSNMFNKMPEKQALLKELLGDQYEGMKKLAGVSQEFVKSGKLFGNPSKTTLSARDLSGIKDVLSVLGNTAATLGIGTALHGVSSTALAEPLAVWALSHVASDRKIINAAIKYAQASQKNNFKEKEVLGNRLFNMTSKFLKHQWEDVQKYPQASHVFSKKFREDMQREKTMDFNNEKEAPIQ
jgi:hypothetical protein